MKLKLYLIPIIIIAAVIIFLALPSLFCDTFPLPEYTGTTTIEPHGTCEWVFLSDRSEPRNSFEDNIFPAVKNITIIDTQLPVLTCLARDANTGFTLSLNGSLTVIENAVTLDVCFSKSDFRELGCTEPILEHVDRVTNLLDEKMNGMYYQKMPGIPNGISEEDFDRCVDGIYEKRK